MWETDGGTNIVGRIVKGDTADRWKDQRSPKAFSWMDIS